MADYTQNLHLKKPARTENYKVADANGNMDIIDEKVVTKEEFQEYVGDNSFYVAEEFNDFVDNNCYVITASGTLTYNENLDLYCVTDLVEIEDKDFIVTASENYHNHFVAFYDENENYINGIKSADGGTVTTLTNYRINTPENAKYVRFCHRSDLPFGIKILNHIGLVAEKLNNVEISLKKDLPQIKDNFTYGDFEIQELEFTKNGYLDNQGIIHAYNGCFATDYVDISNWKDAIKVDASYFYQGVALVFFDDIYTPISYYPTGVSGAGIIKGFVEIPSNAKYAKFTDYTQNVSGSNADYGKLLTYKIKDKWNGLKWVCVGDSLTENNIRTTKHYHDYIAEDTGIEVVNMGDSGSGYAKEHNLETSFYDRIVNVPTDADVITIFGSGNDLSNTVPLGEPDDTELTTLCGFINGTINRLYETYPLAVLGIVTPTPWSGFPPTTEDNAMELYSNAIVAICKRRGIPCLDLYHNSGLRPWEASFRELAYSKDDGGGVHPDETGHKLIAPRFKAFLETLLF